MQDELMAAWKALDELALALGHPELVRKAQQTNRNMISWYLGMIQEAQAAVPGVAVPNGKPKANPIVP